MPRPKLSLTDAATGKRVRVNAFQPGDALVAAPQPILGYCYTTENRWTVYVAGSMPAAMRTAVEEGHTDQEVLLVAELPAGIQEITLPDHRREFRLHQAA
jgi:hypothetical protein